MISGLKTFTVRMVAGANVATVIIMLMVGFAGYVDPRDYPVLSCLGMAFPIFLVINLLFLFFWLIFKWRMAVIPVVGYAMAYLPISIYMPINMPADMPDGVVKVLSYNVQSYSGKPRYDGAFELIFDYVRQCDADIVCIQEHNLSGTKKQRMDSLYAHSDTVRIGTKVQSTLAIYSRYPILRKERISYPSEGNGSAAFYLDIKGDTVLVVNNHFETTHLSLDERRMYKEMLKGEVEKDSMKTESKKLIYKLGESAALRAPQADTVRAYIARNSRYPVIVCGDFNDHPLSYTRRVVVDGLTDCYVKTGRGIGLSYNQKGFFVRIDNMLCSDDIIPYNCKVDNKIDASDHYPIFCWLKMGDKP